MCLFHKWSNWEVTYENQYSKSNNYGMRYLCIEIVQKKHCVKCGYVKTDVSFKQVRAY